MFRFIKNLFSGFLAFLSGLFQGGKKQKPALEQASSEQGKSDSPKPQPQSATVASSKPAQGNFFLDTDEARGYSPNGGSASSSQETRPSASQPAAASTLNLPQPKVTSYSDFSNFGDRRRPGANMSSFLDMARKVRTSS